MFLFVCSLSFFLSFLWLLNGILFIVSVFLFIEAMFCIQEFLDKISRRLCFFSSFPALRTGHGSSRARALLLSFSLFLSFYLFLSFLLSSSRIYIHKLIRDAWQGVCESLKWAQLDALVLSAGQGEKVRRKFVGTLPRSQEMEGESILLERIKLLVGNFSFLFLRLLSFYIHI